MFVWALAWSPDGNWLATGSDDCTIKLWNLATNECTQTITGHQSRIWHLAWSPDGRILAVAVPMPRFGYGIVRRELV
jgi:WD40 repeat protein